MANRIHFAFMCAGHFFGHLFMLVFAAVAALSLSQEWGMSYSELIPYATPGFIGLAVCVVPAGWIADKWSRKGMMILFFIGIGLSSIFTSFAKTPLHMGIGLLTIGVFASIYHPVGISLVVQGRKATGVPLAVNGVFGNMGVACAALIAGFLIDRAGWRSAFVWPGVVSVLIGVAYAGFLYVTQDSGKEETQDDAEKKKTSDALFMDKRLVGRVFAIIFFSTAIGGLIFQSTTFALPQIFDERLAELAISATVVGWYAFMVFAFAAIGQLIVGYLLDRYSVRAVFSVVAALQAVFFGVMPGLSGVSALVIAMAFMLPDPHQRCVDQPCYTKRMEKPGLCVSVHRDLCSFSLFHTFHRVDTFPMELRQSVCCAFYRGYFYLRFRINASKCSLRKTFTLTLKYEGGSSRGEWPSPGKTGTHRNNLSILYSTEHGCHLGHRGESPLKIELGEILVAQHGLQLRINLWFEEGQTGC